MDTSADQPVGSHAVAEQSLVIDYWEYIYRAFCHQDQRFNVEDLWAVDLLRAHGAAKRLVSSLEWLSAISGIPDIGESLFDDRDQIGRAHV